MSGTSVVNDSDVDVLIINLKIELPRMVKLS